MSDDQKSHALTRLEGEVMALRNRVDKNETDLESNRQTIQNLDKHMMLLTEEIKNLGASVEKMVKRVDDQTGKNEEDLEHLSSAIVSALEEISISFQESNQSLTAAATSRIEKIETRMEKIETRMVFWAGGIAVIGFILGILGILGKPIVELVIRSFS